MAWTYGPDFSLARDRIRVLIGDTDIEDQLVADEEITLYTTGQYAQSSDLAAAIELGRFVLKKLARQAVRVSGGGTSVDLTARVDEFRKTLDDLIAKSAEGAVPFAGGISKSDVEAREADTDRVSPFFTRTTGEPNGTPSTPDQWAWR